jgi:hypothetical protein
MRQVLRNERGMALALAMVGLVVAGALVAGAFFAGTQEQRVGENVRRIQQSFAIAEGGAYDVFRTWKPESINVGLVFPADTYRVANPATPTGGSYDGSVYKLNRNVYLVDITGRDKASKAATNRMGGARQRVGILGTVKQLSLQTRASLTTKGAVKLAGNAFVDGGIHVPPGWTSCDSVRDTAKAGIRTPDTAAVSGEQTHAAGNPPLQYDPTVTDANFDQFGDVSYADLALRATIQYPGGENLKTEPVVTNGVCDQSVKTNWGDGVNPAAPCGKHFVIVHAAGDLTLNNVQGQGILLVDGDLSVQGSYQWFGVAIVRGKLKTAGGGSAEAHFWGATMAQNVDLEVQNITGNATVNYSKCAIIQALQFTQVVTPMRSRGWTQLF